MNIKKIVQDFFGKSDYINISEARCLLQDAIEQYHKEQEPLISVTRSGDNDWAILDLDNCFKCRDCGHIVETPYFISTDVPGRCSPLLDGPRCKECHDLWGETKND